MPRFIPAPELETFATPIIAEHHPHLVDEYVVFMWQETATRTRGQVTLGTASVARGKNGVLYFMNLENCVDEEQVFVITIAQDTWIDLSPKERKRLVDHELCHCAIRYSKTGDAEYYIRPHDIEEFTEIIDRHVPPGEDILIKLGADDPNDDSSIILDTAKY